MIVIAGDVVHGPFKSVEELEDRLVCDGAELPLSVIGEYELSGDDSLAPSPVPPEPTIPKSVTRRQALQALLITGVTVAMIEAAIAASGMTELQQGLALIELRDSQEFERNRPLVISIGAAMALDLDDLFILADTL